MKQLNIKIIISFLGLTSVLNGIFMMVAYPFSVYHNEPEQWGILKAGITTISLGLLLWFFNRNATKNLGKKEGYIIVTFGWLKLSFTGALPYVFSASIPDFTDAFFETMSSITTTGASILNDIEAMGHV